MVVNENSPLLLSQDQHTIMSAWAIRNYLNADPDANQHDHHDRCKLYVQILQPENKILLDPKTAGEQYRHPHSQTIN